MLFKSITKIGGLTLISRLFGFIRDVLTAAFLGTGPIADAFFVAFRLPNFFRRLFAEGAFSAAFVPIFTRLATNEGRDASLLFAGRITSILILALVALTIVAEAFMPAVITVIAPGFTEDPEKFELTVLFSRITFPYLMLISMVALIGGVLNGLEKFGAFAAAPIFLNLVLIGALIGLTPILPTAGHAMAIGVLLAGIVQLLWMLAGCWHAGIRLLMRRPKLSPEVRNFLRLMGPGLLGAGVMQVNLLISVFLASFLPTGSVSYLYYADRLAQLPLGVIGVAIGTALLPILTRQLRSQELTEAQHTFNRAIEIGLFLTVPAMVALMIIPSEILSTLFERGAFDATATEQTALALIAFAFGIPAYVLIKVLSPGFFAREDTKTPVKIAIGIVLLNFVLNVALMQVLAHVGIALGTAIAAWVNALVLLVVLLRRQHLVLDPQLKATLLKILLASGIMGTSLYGLKQWSPDLGSGLSAEIFWLMVLIIAGKTVYLATAAVTGAIKLSQIKQLMKRQPKEPTS